ncbi:RNA polymerase sigma factor [Pseudomonas sp. MM211]|uniref:RNA polymerase sigma factor n=1 Tax=Pseudomonas sp. MM211 TaxID=2866808 RepID=UPI001CEC32E3|nr:RNA polymerase sigma factor [Pseudomonas sp. MM211]UCJ17805.1 RNA polymerase sigma factor [Pseudomonas sp. MM211]
MSDLDLKGLFQQHARALQSFLLRKSRDPHLAADLVQESFLRLTEQARHDHIENTPAYLYRTARNLLIDHRRQQERRKTDLVGDEVLNAVEDEVDSLEDTTERQQRMELLQRAVAELPPRTREIFHLNRIEGLTHAEVARRLEISDSSVQKHLSKALSHVMERLGASS